MLQPARQRLPLMLALCALVVSACTAAPLPGPDRPLAAEAPGAPPKVLTIAILREPPGLHADLIQGGGSGIRQVYNLAQDLLVREDARGALVPQLAVEPISTESGTWRIFPDGSMETTWKLRPGIKWHDGTPFTAADLLFSFTVYKDPQVPNVVGQPLALMESATAPDPLTFVVRWSSTYVGAGEAPGLIPMPRQRLESAYHTDRSAFAAGPWFTTEYVGLGPYRLERWDRGVSMKFSRFGDYYRGLPPIDTVAVRFLSDTGTMVANLLAEAVDVVLPQSVDIAVALDLRRRWAGTGNQVLFELGALRYLEVQHRAEHERPRFSTTSQPVRQALYQALDRNMLADALGEGSEPSADSWFPPNGALRSQVEAWIPRFPFDPARAQQLLVDAGWARGGDGTWQRDGERFDIQISGTQGTSTERELNIIADAWKAIGVEARLYVVPTALVGDREYRSKLPGAGLTSLPHRRLTTDPFHSRSIASETNRWSGPNRSGYAKPRVDEVLDRLAVTIDPLERITLHRQLLQEQMGDVALMPLYWIADPVLALRGVKGIQDNSTVESTWNIFQWDKL